MVSVAHNEAGNWRISSFPTAHQTSLKIMKEAPWVGAVVLAETLLGDCAACLRTLALDECSRCSLLHSSASEEPCGGNMHGSLTPVKGFIVCSKYKMVIVGIMAVS